MKYLSLIVLLSLLACKSSNNADQVPAATNKTVDVEPQQSEPATKARSSNTAIQPIIKSTAEWKEQLSKEQYYVLREEGTERPFTSDLLKEKRTGTFTCAACNLALFDSGTKFESGTGWPSFYEPLTSEHIAENTDYNIGYARTEVECARCGGHLGHVFKDGPEPTGLRYCINGVSLAFEPK